MSEPLHVAETQRRVVCAANRHHKTKIVFCSARHFDSTMRTQIRRANLDMREQSDTLFEQGFIDQFGVFMTREEALTVALAAGQRIYRCGGDETRLYSENLY